MSRLFVSQPSFPFQVWPDFSAGLVCSSFSAGACAILHALCWSRQHQQVCHFSSIIWLSFCPLLHLFFYLNLSGRNCLLSPVLSSYNGHSFLPVNDAATCALCNPLWSLISCIHSCLFLDWRCTVSSKFFDTQVPSIFIEELVLPRHAHCVLCCLRCSGHSLLLGSYLSRIGRIENSSCNACRQSFLDTSHLILHCPTMGSLYRSLFGDSLSLCDLWSRPWGVARFLGLHGLPSCPHSSEGVV